MSLDSLNVPAASRRLAPVEPRWTPLFCLVLLTAACALASFALACATPFAAFAVVAAAMLPLPSALAMLAAAWLINQAIGFDALGYPLDATTMLWGGVILAAAVAAAAAAKLVLLLLPRSTNPVALSVALIGAYAAFELVLFAATPLLGGTSDFTAAIIGRLGILNVLWLLGLVAACAVVRLLIRVGERRVLFR